MSHRLELSALLQRLTTYAFFMFLYFACSCAAYNSLCLPISHQWLSWTQPDPANVHFASIVEAARTLMVLHSLNKDELFVWIECAFSPDPEHTPRTHTQTP